MSWEVVPYNPASRERFPVAGVLEVNGPSLDLDLRNGTLDGRITFSRASTATYFDASGVLQTAAVNAPRFDYGAAGGAQSLGLLIEEPRANSLKNSGVPATQTTASLATGTYTLWVVGSGSATSSAGTATGSGFGAATAGSPNTFTLTGAGTVTVTVSGSLTRFQLELGAFATSYIPTTSSTATRARDLASMPVGPWFNPNAGTLVCGVVLPTATTASLQTICEISDGTNNNRFQISRATSSNNTQALLVVATSILATLTPGALTPGSAFKVGFATDVNGSISAQDGSAGATTASTGNLSAATSLYIGVHGNNLLPANGYIRRIRYWPRALSQNDLNGITT